MNKTEKKRHCVAVLLCALGSGFDECRLLPACYKGESRSIRMKGMARASPHLLDLIQFVVDYKDSASALGITLSCSGDFELFRRTLDSIDDHGALQEVFDPRLSEVTRDNAFWIRGTDSNGRVVHTQAIRYFDLGSLSLADHLDRFRRFYAVPGVGIDPLESDVAPARQAFDIRGRITYHGEIWVHPAFRGRQLAKVLPRLAVTLAQMQWQPDYLFGIVIDPVAYKGITTQYGYFECYPNCYAWRTSAGELIRREWLVLGDPEQFFELVSAEARDTECLRSGSSTAGPGIEDGLRLAAAGGGRRTIRD